MNRNTASPIVQMLSAIPLIFLVTHAFGQGSRPAGHQHQPERVRITISDFGINQWHDRLRTGEDFEHANSHVFNSIPSEGQILLAMPERKNSQGRMTVADKDKLTQTYFEVLEDRVDQALDGGLRDIEVQIVQEINSPGYARGGPFGRRQDMVNDFGECAYQAIGRLVEHIESQGNRNIEVNAIVGSNGAKVLSENVSAWQPYLDRAAFFDGRAFISAMRPTIRSLGEENVWMFNTEGDLWASNRGHPSFLMPSSIANHDVVKTLKREFTGVRAFWIKPTDRKLSFGSGHVAGMNENAEFLLKEFTGNSYTKPHKTSGLQLLDWCRSGKTGHLPKRGGLSRFLPWRREDDKALSPSPPPPPPPPPPPTAVGQIGGVMLHNVAQVEGAVSPIDVATAGFSLILDKGDAYVSEENLSRFVTALWAVYFSRTSPGISIDPIAPGVDKHLVRYIGDVKDTDLGRVMLEADYMMKKWAVGTDRPEIPGFKNPDDLAADRRRMYVGAMSRFWLVPESMKFRQTDNMLLYDSGRMTVKTEFLLRSDHGPQADPANEAFARYFTRHYAEIAERYPVYQELLEYGKLVALAKYIKEQRVPLYWFLMANRHLVRTGPSPSTVDALSKGSEHFRNVRIEGGVDLGEPSTYVRDHNAPKIISQIVTRMGDGSRQWTHASRGNRHVLRRASFNLRGRSYSVVPAQLARSVCDERGVGYATDMAWRAEGYELNDRSLAVIGQLTHRQKIAERLRPAMARLSGQGVESELVSLWTDARKETEVEVERFVETLTKLKGQEFATDSDFADAIERVAGSDNLERYGEIVTAEARFATDLELVRFQGPDRDGASTCFGRGWQLLLPYRIRPAGSARRRFLNTIIPERMAVEDRLTGKQEILTFDEDRHAAAGYVPEASSRSAFAALLLLTDGSYMLADKLNNTFLFDQRGRLTDLAMSEDYVMHVTYCDRVDEAFAALPYAMDVDSSQRVRMGSASVPRELLVKDLESGTANSFAIDAYAQTVRYAPSPPASRYRAVDLMTDGSLRLTDAYDNQIVFDSTGVFKAFMPSGQSDVVESISMGNYKIAFSYEIGRAGALLVAGATLSKVSDGAEPIGMVAYQYDDQERLTDRLAWTPPRAQGAATARN